MTIAITCSAFSNQGSIPQRYTADGADVSPPLAWQGVPEGAKELAIICDDPDAPTAEPWVHWVIYGIPSSAKGLPQNVPRQETLPDGTMQGMNTWPRLGYNGPMPPPGHGTHHYHFKVYAVGQATGLKPRATKNDVLAAIEGHVLAQGKLIGTYER